LTGLVFKTDLN